MGRIFRKTGINSVILLFVYLLNTLSVLALSGYGITQINMGSGLIFGMICINGNFFIKHYRKDLLRVSIIGALIGTLSLSLGRMIRDMDLSGLGRRFGLSDMIFAIGIFIFLYMVFNNIFVVLNRITIPNNSIFQMDKKHCLMGVILLFICWLPYYLTFFPGIFGSDPIESIRMGTNGFAWTNHHPILYTMFIKFFIVLFEQVLGINGAMAVMILVQQILLASCLVYCINFMWQRGINKYYLFCVFMFFALNPVIAVFSVYATKDVLFSSAVLVWMIMIFKLQEKIAQVKLIVAREWFVFALTAFFVVFLRNNGSFIAIGTLLILILKHKKYWKNFTSILLILLACIVIQKQIIFPAFHMEESSFAESLSIPLQQIAQTVVDEGQMTVEEQTYLEQLMPFETMTEAYQAGYTDPVKFHEQFDDTFLNQDKLAFIKVWAGMLPDNLDSYIKAYLLQTAGYWDISQTDSLTTYGVIDNEIGIKQTDVVKNICGHSLQPIIEKLILICRKLPVLCYLTNMAMLFFSTLICGYLLLKKKKGIICFMPLWIGWLTIMIAAPASCKFRYMLPMYLTLPFVLWMTMRFGLNNVDKEQGEE